MQKYFNDRILAICNYAELSEARTNIRMREYRLGGGNLNLDRRR